MPAPGPIEIRQAAVDEVFALPDLEVAAGQRFADHGMPEIATDSPASVEVLASFAAVAGCWVAVLDGRPVGYLLAGPVDDATHIEQVSVHPDQAGHRLAARLIDAAEAADDRSSTTLTTFRYVPWNAPYYRRLGFVEIPDGALFPGLAALRRHEADLGLDAWPRLAMRRYRAGHR
ncbi:MAG: GNAT family N-acetyltransferase [Jatrophihabitans sp.]